MNNPKRYDDLEIFFDDLEKNEDKIEYVDYFAMLCFFVYAVAHTHHANLIASIAKGGFVVAAVLAICLRLFVDLFVRFDLDKKRRDMLIAQGLCADYSHFDQVGFWNNEIKESPFRLFVSLTENVFFYPKLLVYEFNRLAVVCLIIAITAAIAVSNFTVEYAEFLVLIVLFSDGFLLKLIRIGWALRRFNYVYDSCCTLILEIKHDKVFGNQSLARVMGLFGDFEAIKAKLKFRPKKSTFRRLNEQLSREWDSELMFLLHQKNKN